ncbi:peptidoglycan-binding domain-containing protein [Kitasatospora sp. HPMI-4]|uniref:peptidoglycan-binding domain-containing protein n=1 Tax=Kitasatospora sp. HPMI-4 TaxID=3448443 RepID=UPI003F1DC956
MSRFIRATVAAAMTTTALWIGAAPSHAASLPTCDGRITNTTMPAIGGDSADCRLAYGDQGDGVKALQESFNYCNGESLTVDGVFGSATKAAVLRVQSRGGITADGIYGPNTRSHMSFLLMSSRPNCTVPSA